MYLNKAFIIGNLTRDPEEKSLPSGSKVTSFSVATNFRFKNQQGQWEDKSDFHNIVVFGRQAETSAQYLRKGQQVMIEGRIQTRSWEKDGAKQYRTEIVADRVQFGDKPGGARGPSGNSSTSNDSAPTNSDEGSQEYSGGKGGDAIEYPSEEINPEDIPF